MRWKKQGLHLPEGDFSGCAGLFSCKFAFFGQDKEVHLIPLSD